MKKKNYYKSLFIRLKLQRLSLVFPQVPLVIKGKNPKVYIFQLLFYSIYQAISYILYSSIFITIFQPKHTFILFCPFFQKHLKHFFSLQFFIFYNIHFHLIFQGLSKKLCQQPLYISFHSLNVMNFSSCPKPHQSHETCRH